MPNPSSRFKTKLPLALHLALLPMMLPKRGASAFCGSLPRLPLAIQELPREGRTLGLADGEATPHRVRALWRSHTMLARADTYLLFQAEHVGAPVG